MSTDHQDVVLRQLWGHCDDNSGPDNFNIFPIFFKNNPWAKISFFPQDSTQNVCTASQVAEGLNKKTKNKKKKKKLFHPNRIFLWSRRCILDVMKLSRCGIFLKSSCVKLTGTQKKQNMPRWCLIMMFIFSLLIVGMFLHYWETLKENFTDNTFFCPFICESKLYCFMRSELKNRAAGLSLVQCSDCLSRFRGNFKSLTCNF